MLHVLVWGSADGRWAVKEEPVQGTVCVSGRSWPGSQADTPVQQFACIHRGVFLHSILELGLKDNTH